jgi:hypothetical protein
MTPLRRFISSSSRDQIVKGDVTIKKISKHKYIITFRKIGKFLLYQVWDKNNINSINSKRIVEYVSAKKWVNLFIQQNENLKLNNKSIFTPTTIMEFGNHKYAFIINSACINSSGNVVFNVSTKKIQLQNNSSQKLIQLPIGDFNNIRFDIDDWVFDLMYDTMIAPLYIVIIFPPTNEDYVFIDIPVSMFSGDNDNSILSRVKYIEFDSNSARFYINVDSSAKDDKITQFQCNPDIYNNSDYINIVNRIKEGVVSDEDNNSYYYFLSTFNFFDDNDNILYTHTHIPR